MKEKKALNLIYNIYKKDRKRAIFSNNFIFGNNNQPQMLFGDENNNFILGGQENDIINGDDGDDYLGGGGGDDVIRGGQGDDILEGNHGNDHLLGDSGNDFIKGGLGNDTLKGGDGDDILQGGDGDDIINGGSGNNQLEGYSGNDTFIVGSGNNIIYGDFGINTLHLPETLDKYRFIAPNILQNITTNSTNTFYKIDKFIFNNFPTMTLDEIYSINNISIEVIGDISGIGDENTRINGKIDIIDNIDAEYVFSIEVDGINGFAEIDPVSGEWSYNPKNDFYGDDNFIIRLSSSIGYNKIQNINIIIKQVDNPSVIMGDINGSGEANTNISGKLDVFDEDGLSGDIFFIKNNPVNGTAEINSSTGLWTYNPYKNFYGNDKFTVSIVDNFNFEILQDINLLITNTIISGDFIGIGDEDTIISGKINVEDENSFNEDKFFILENPIYGKSEIDSKSGLWKYIPNKNFFGEDKFVINIVNKTGNAKKQEINITINSVNDPTIITGDVNMIVNEDEIINGKLNVEDGDGFGDEIFYISIEPLNGKAEINSKTGEWNYIPNQNFFGTDTFLVNIIDKDNNISTQHINITVNSINDPTIITGDFTGVGDEDNIITGTINVEDNDGFGEDIFFISTEPLNGTAEINSKTGDWSYLPKIHYYGLDNFSIKIIDKQNNVTLQEINLTINPINDITVIKGDINGVGDEDNIISGKIDVVDEDGFSEDIFSISKNAINGIATINSKTGNWNYIPNSNFFGNDKFEISIIDILGNITLQEIDIVVNSINDLTIITGDINGICDQDSNIIGKINVVDEDGFGEDIFSISNNTINGIAEIDSKTGEWKYVPNKGFFGTDMFSVKIIDINGNIILQEINLVINYVNYPSIVTGNFTGIGDEDNIITGVINVEDENGFNEEIFFISKNATNGLANINSKTGEWIYRPNDNFFGNDEFLVKIVDKQDNNTLQKINLKINSVNDPSIITGNLNGMGNEDTIVSGKINVVDEDGFGEDIFYISKNAINGKAEINSKTGEWKYTPNKNFFGKDKFFINIKDILGNITQQVINIKINSVNDPSIITGDINGSGNEDTIISGKINVVDEDGFNEDIFSISKNALNGNAEIKSRTGEWTYIPNKNFFGLDEFIINIIDKQNNITSQKININVISVNDLTIITGNIEGIGDENTIISGKLNVIDEDEFNEDIFFIFENSVNGDAEINSKTGEWTYTPNEDYFGLDQFKVQIIDSLGNITLQEINIKINSIDKPPIVSGGTNGEGDEDTVLVGVLEVIDNNGLTGNNFFIERNADNGIAVIEPNSGFWNYLPYENFSGEDKFTVSIIDDLGYKALQEINLIINSINDKPIISGDIYVIGDEDTIVNGKLDVIDVDGLDENIYFIFKKPEFGKVSINSSSGEWSYTPNENFNGNDKFTVNIVDSLKNITKQDIYIKINPVNDDPIILDGFIGEGEEDIIIKNNLEVIEYDGLNINSFSIIKLAENGICQINSKTGSWLYKPNDNFFGKDKFTVSITDNTKNSFSQEINLSIGEVRNHSICKSLLCINLFLKKGWNLLYNPFDFDLTYSGSEIVYNEYIKNNVIKSNSSFWIMSEQEKEVVVETPQKINLSKLKSAKVQNIIIEPGFSIIGVDKECKCFGNILIFKFTGNGYQEVINGRLLRPFVGYWIYSNYKTSIMLV